MHLITRSCMSLLAMPLIAPPSLSLRAMHLITSSSWSFSYSPYYHIKCVNQLCPCLSPQVCPPSYVPDCIPKTVHYNCPWLSPEACPHLCLFVSSSLPPRPCPWSPNIAMPLIAPSSLAMPLIAFSYLSNKHPVAECMMFATSSLIELSHLSDEATKTGGTNGLTDCLLFIPWWSGWILPQQHTVCILLK